MTEQTELNFEGFSCPVPLPDITLDRIVLGHGSGGRMSHNLVCRIFLPDLQNPALNRMDDGAVLSLPGGNGRLVMSTDAHVVQPLFFPGGDIGRLAVCGTVNDLAMMGARPLWLSAAFVLEEGLPIETLQQVVRSMQEAAHEAQVHVVSGDTKVVERGKADGLYIATAGVGWLPEGINISGTNARPGDVVLVSGTMGDHGIAVLSEREGLGFETELKSDVAPLNGLVAAMLEAAPGAIHTLRDPTRGGLATTLNEIAMQSGVSIELEEERIPLRPAVRSACEMLGFDPLYVANEGKLVACVAPEAADDVLAAMKAHPYGRDAAIIGRVGEGPSGQVTIRTPIGGTRVLDMLSGEMLPRIC
ncbi:MAG: hydrogenase expression/formation protein HypE [Anaerolineae bacterium]|nr:hydrogenase expression/formation protein HypE [Anaerolineae bacterium]